MKIVTFLFFFAVNALMVGAMLTGIRPNIPRAVAVEAHEPNPSLKAAVERLGPRERQEHLLAFNIYHESKGLRGTRDVGWRSVAAVVFNRLEDPRFPKTLEGVILESRGNSCAFSWYCDGTSDRPRDIALYREILKAARTYLAEYEAGTWRDPTHGAHSYHATSIEPNEYFEHLKPVKAIHQGNQGHVFYTDRV